MPDKVGSSHWLASTTAVLKLLLAKEVTVGSSNSSALITAFLNFSFAVDTIVGSSHLSASIVPMTLFGFNFVWTCVLVPVFDLNKVSFFISYVKSILVFAGVISPMFWIIELSMTVSAALRFDVTSTETFVSPISDFLNRNKSSYVSVRSSSGSPMKSSILKSGIWFIIKESMALT